MRGDLPDPPHRVVGEIDRASARQVDLNELIPEIPGVVGDSAAVGLRRRVAVVVVGIGSRRRRGELVGTIVGVRRHAQRRCSESVNFSEEMCVLPAVSHLQLFVAFL